MRGSHTRFRLMTVTLILIGIAAGATRLLWHSDRPPNIVLIIVDTLRADKLGVYGSPSPASRELDALAHEGVVLEQVVAQASWTRSSVASMLTGLYPRRLPVIKEQWDPLPSGVESLAEVLRRGGYLTIGVTANPQLNLDFKFDQGFDEYIESSVTFAWMKDVTGKEKAGRGNAVRVASDVLGQSLDLLKAANRRPVYLQALIMDVHAHHRIPQESVDADLQGLPDSSYLQAVRNATRPLADFITKAWSVLGKDTVFIITADHGEGLNDHPGVHASGKHGNLLYRSHLHVPCIVLGPADRIGKPGRIAGLSRLMDLYPTIVELAGVRLPSSLDGSSLLSAMRTSTPVVQREPTISETRWRRGVNKIAVTDGEWLLVENRDQWGGSDPVELFPFSAAQNGAATNSLSQHPEVGAALQQAIGTFESRVPLY